MQTLTLLTAAKPSNATQEVTFENVCVGGWGGGGYLKFQGSE